MMGRDKSRKSRRKSGKQSAKQTGVGNQGHPMDIYWQLRCCCHCQWHPRLVAIACKSCCNSILRVWLSNISSNRSQNPEGSPTADRTKSNSNISIGIGIGISIKRSNVGGCQTMMRHVASKYIEKQCLMYEKRDMNTFLVPFATGYR
ncbi:hypothetical protein ACLKA7_003576 [Drosophila subpalustris]